MQLYAVRSCDGAAGADGVQTLRLPRAPPRRARPTPLLASADGASRDCICRCVLCYVACMVYTGLYCATCGSVLVLVCLIARVLGASEPRLCDSWLHVAGSIAMVLLLVGQWYLLQLQYLSDNGGGAEGVRGGLAGV